MNVMGGVEKKTGNRSEEIKGIKASTWRKELLKIKPEVGGGAVF